MREEKQTDREGQEVVPERGIGNANGGSFKKSAVHLEHQEHQIRKDYYRRRIVGI